MKLAPRGSGGHFGTLELREAVRGRLPPARAREIRHHCAVCDECASERELIRFLRRARGLSDPIEHSEVQGTPVPANIH